MSWSECVSWVDNNKKMFAWQERRFSHISAYDLSDFVQEAYLVAFNTSKLFSVGSPEFLDKFRNAYRDLAWCDLVTVPCISDVVSAPVVLNADGKKKKYVPVCEIDPEYRKPIIIESFCEEMHSRSTESLCDLLNEPPVDIHRTMIHLTKYLLKGQKSVFITVLGLAGREGCLNYTHAGAKLGRSKDSVSRIFNNCCSRLNRLVSDGTINVDSFPRVNLTALNGGKISSLITANVKAPISYTTENTEQREIRLAA